MLIHARVDVALGNDITAPLPSRNSGRQEGPRCLTGTG